MMNDLHDKRKKKVRAKEQTEEGGILVPVSSRENSYINDENQIQTKSLPPQLAQYTDFRQYLRDFYEYKKRKSTNSVRTYSYAAFSAAADIKSPNYLKLIIEGERNLSIKMIKNFSKALGLSKEEFQEFKALVLYGQTKDPLERNRYLKLLAELRTKKKILLGQIDTKAWSKVPNWISWILYTLADQRHIDFNPSALREVLRNRASIDEIKQALNLLINSGELKRNTDGSIQKGRELIDGYENIPTAMIRKIQAELIYLGLESLFQDSPTEREFGALTLALTHEEFEQMKFELRQLRKRFFKKISIERGQSKGDRIYQLNIQFFPVSNPVKNRST